MTKSNRKELKNAVVRIAGDSGDGIQVSGSRLSMSSAMLGQDLATLPDFPAEIRAPAGTLAGVSGFQIQFSSEKVFTPGNKVDCLVALNPAALKKNINDLKKGGILITNQDSFGKKNLEKAGYDENPLENGSIEGYRSFPCSLIKSTVASVKEFGLGTKDSQRCKNFYTLGLLYWLYDHPLDSTEAWITKKFKNKNESLTNANLSALKAGYNYGETAELFQESYKVEKASYEPGFYRNISGNQALCLGLLSASSLAQKSFFLGSYPITPASDILHQLSSYKKHGISVFQAEDEIAAVCSAIGASFSGSLGITSTSGPGFALKQEGVNLALMMELPLVVINVQRAGPSTGMPTKPEQTDLLQTFFGRNGEAPLPIIAPSTPADCFEAAIEACKVALKYMTPVVLISDGYLANGTEPWKVPDISNFDDFPVEHPSEEVAENFLPYSRNKETLARPWAIPGTAGLTHRLGGLEKEHQTGNVCYVPENHQFMTDLRQEKVNRVQAEIPDLKIDGNPNADLLVLGWGSSKGAIEGAVKEAQKEGYSVACSHLRFLNPFPKNLVEILNQFETILIPELNMGQLKLLLKSQTEKKIIGLNKVTGQPFGLTEVLDKIKTVLSNKRSIKAAN